jgi:hypothetical protein
METAHTPRPHEGPISPRSVLEESLLLHIEMLTWQREYLQRLDTFSTAQVGAFDLLTRVAERQGAQVDILIATASRIEHLMDLLMPTLSAMRQALESLNERLSKFDSTSGYI